VRPLALTFAVMFMCFTSVSASRVVLSLYALNLGASASAVGFLLSTFYVFPLVLSWSIGSWGDRVGARPLLAIGAMAGALGMSVPFVFRSLGAIYVACALTGFSFSFYNVLLQNLVGLLSAPHERMRNFSNSSMLGAGTTLLGPLIAGFGIDHLGGPATSLLIAAFPFAGAVLVLVFGRVLPGRTRHAQQHVQGSLRATLEDRRMLRLLVTSGLVQLGGDLFQFYMPIYGHAKGLSGSAIAIVLGSASAASIVVRFVMPRLIQRLGEYGLIAWSFYASSLAFAVIPFFSGAYSLSTIGVVFGLAMGCGQPVTTMLMFSQSPAGRSGEALGLRQSFNNLMRVAGPAFFGLVATGFGLGMVFWMNAAMMVGGGRLASHEVRAR
jgi:MFS family permease